MTELISLKNVSRETKIKLIKELGYDTDGIFILKNGKKFKDEFTKDPIRLNDMLILPGKSPVVILDNNPLSISSYFEKYGEL